MTQRTNAVVELDYPVTIDGREHRFNGKSLANEVNRALGI